ncbi:site-specific integrase [Geomonas anaerohicana]|uniref:Site-specific integrase n=1 Tax=Geomonas anaerohicana TaxID=2798583 RepID=A0ABS0YK54_9BACT|nr:site-specific integrase [Geomonas anaerohicana]MBJ6752700.1 site-specific integrase [Geomonas anaerohicana]
MMVAGHSFAKGKTQAKRMIVEWAAAGIRLNVGTERNAKQSLSLFADWLSSERRGDLRTCERQAAIEYLEQRAEIIQQKALDQDRQSLDRLMVYRGGQESLPRIQSERDRILKGRAYTAEQARLIAAGQRSFHATTTELSFRCSIRAHEAYTLMRADEMARSDRRSWRNDLFSGRDGVLYTVTGKGGLSRWICVPHDLAARLEERRLETPRQVTDRGVRYLQHYDIGAGQAWSQSVSSAARRQLGWSNGAHGLRHSYAQERVKELQASGYGYRDAKEICSMELGHFRSSVVEWYLR